MIPFMEKKREVSCDSFVSVRELELLVSDETLHLHGAPIGLRKTKHIRDVAWHVLPCYS